MTKKKKVSSIIIIILLLLAFLWFLSLIVFKDKETITEIVNECTFKTEHNGELSIGPKGSLTGQNLMIKTNFERVSVFFGDRPEGIYKMTWNFDECTFLTGDGRVFRGPSIPCENWNDFIGFEAINKTNNEALFSEIGRQGTYEFEYNKSVSFGINEFRFTNLNKSNDFRHRFNGNITLELCTV